MRTTFALAVVLSVALVSGCTASRAQAPQREPVRQPPVSQIHESPPAGSIAASYGPLPIGAITYSFPSLWISHIRAFKEGSTESQEVEINDYVYLIESGKQDKQWLRVALANGTIY